MNLLVIYFSHSITDHQKTRFLISISSYYDFTHFTTFLYLNLFKGFCKNIKSYKLTIIFKIICKFY